MLGATALLVGACTCGEPPPPPPEPIWTPQVRPDHILTYGDPPPGGVAISLRFKGVGTLFRGFFADPERLEPLSLALGACTGEDVELVVTWDEAERIGRVVLDLSVRGLSCRPEATETGVDLSPLTPVSEAVADYRNSIAQRKDLRVYTFRDGLYLRDARGAVLLWDRGNHPTDGTTFDPCFGLDAWEVCAAGERELGVTTLELEDRAHRKRVQAALTGG